MIKNRIYPRILNPAPDAPVHNFFYRLVSSQRFLAIIGLVFLVVIIFPLARTYSQRRLVEQEIADVQAQIQDFESQNQQLKDLITYLQSDQSLEEQARLNLNLKKPGEAVVVVENKIAGVNEIAAATADSAEGNLAKWWHYFFD
ncbi:MAG: septum formation initiator family protein [Patescibacteria group bacterium]